MAMSKPRFTLCVLVSLFTLGLNISIPAQTKENKTETATVSGLVTLKGEPARNVTVLLQGQRSGVTTLLRARTDESGRYKVTGVAAGKCMISALAPGYATSGDN